MSVFLKEENEENLYRYLNNLKIAKQNGELDTYEKLSDQTLKWRNIVEYHILEDSLTFYSIRCRVETLELLVESKESTLRFTHKELDLILLFIKFNLCERRLFIGLGLIKQALKRLKNSLALIKLHQVAPPSSPEEVEMNYYKNKIASEINKITLTFSYETSEQLEQDVKNYTTFFINLREMCINNLKPDAVDIRRFFSLQILLLMVDLHNEFKDIEWSQEQAKKIFECLLHDTDETNNEMAYQILKSINPLFFIDSVQDIIEIAFKLDKSIQCLDSTAAYMLKISKLFPNIKNNCYICGVYNSEDNIPDVKTLHLVLMLYTELQEALALAKQNIRMAIAKHSIYGYLSCMRKLLIDCDFKSIKTNKVWQNTIHNIIFLCFDLSNSVSMVVKYCSPKGHLSMDLETLNSNNDASLPEKKIITSKMILLCSWCTIKEISQLFSLFATNASKQINETGLLTRSHMINMMEHLALLLYDMRHEDACKYVFFNFHQLCKRLWKSNLHEYVIHYLHDLLIRFTGLVDGYSIMYTTRRKAGIPLVIEAILSSEPNKRHRTSAFHSVMKILLKFSTLTTTRDNNLSRQIRSIMYGDTIFSTCNITEEKIKHKNELHNDEIKLNIVKTHSMHILISLFTTSEFSDEVSKYIVPGLDCVFVNFDRNIWRINIFINLVSQFGKSPVYKIRELAARALVPLLKKQDRACKVLGKLFLILCRARESQMSANAVHGYLLQIFEILTKLSDILIQRLQSEITDFLSMADWILKELERGTNGSTCFLLATLYINILQALYNLDKNIIESSNLENILHILQQHLIKKDLLISGPGEQIYKISIIKFMLCVGKSSNFWQTMHNEQSKAFSIYSQLLIMPEIDIQIIAWTTVIDIVKKESCQQRKIAQRESLNTYAIRTAANFAEDLFKNRKLQNSICDLLYYNLTDINECITDKYEICSLVLKKLYLQFDASNIDLNINYWRLLGKCMVILTHELKDEEFKVEHIKNIYKKVCDNIRWLPFENKDFRSSVFVILHDLFNKNDFDTEHCHPMLDWWTMLLQLLVDDNADIRHEAAILICKIEPRSRLECFERILITFFQKFNKMVADKYPEIAISAFFCWSVSLFKKIYYKIDGVFNKNLNYGVYEPSKISQYCLDATKSIMERYSIDSLLPSEVVSWINYRLNTNFSVLLSFRDIVRKYNDNLFIVSTEPTKLLDPIFNDKLFQIQICEEYISL